MNYEPTQSDTHLDALLHTDAYAELARTDTALADRFISRLDTAPRRTASGPAAIGVGLLAVAMVTSLAVWLPSRPAPPTLTPVPHIATHTRPEIDPRIPAAIDDAADDLLNPLMRELQALASISRDSVRSIANYLPNPIGG